MIALLDSGAGADIVTWPMLLAGLGVGALASQLGSVTVSSIRRPGSTCGQAACATSAGSFLNPAALIGRATARYAYDNQQS